MKNLTLTISLILAVLLGSAGTSWGADFDKGYEAYYSGDFATALQEFMPLAEQGNADAQYYLGLMYEYGKGVPKDDKTAMKWWTLAAEQGNADAQIQLGGRYLLGERVPKDDVYAYMWFNIAAASGSKRGRMHREGLAREMTADQVAEAQKLSRECVRKEYKGC